MKEEELQDNFKKWCILVKIYMTNNKNSIPIKKLTEQINIDITHPYFKEVYDYLLNSNIIIITDRCGATKFIKINNKELLLLIEKSIIWDFFVKFTQYKTGGLAIVR